MAIETSRLYLDTNVLIYLLEGHEIFGEMVATMLSDHVTLGGSLVTSALTITEFMAGTGLQDASVLRQVPRLQFVVLDELLAERAAQLQKKEHLQIGDAIHLATVTQSQADLLTNDKLLARAAARYTTVRALDR